MQEVTITTADTASEPELHGELKQWSATSDGTLMGEQFLPWLSKASSFLRCTVLLKMQ
jgi:hypothetical protein